jgi:Domain of unknown function (DUF892)
MQKDSLRELYIDELRDLYNAETQLVRALPKMAEGSCQRSTAPGVRRTFAPDVGTRFAFGADLRAVTGEAVRKEVPWHGRAGQRRR